MKKLLLISILIFSQNAMAIDNIKKEEFLKKCLTNNTCEIVMASWLVSFGQMNVYIRKDLKNKINDNEYIINYFSKILVEKRKNPISLIELDRNLSKANHNAPFYNNEKFMNNLKNSNEVILFEYEPEKIIMRKHIN